MRIETGHCVPLGLGGISNNWTEVLIKRLKQLLLQQPKINICSAVWQCSMFFCCCENQFETRNTDLSLQYGPASENQYRCVVVHDVFQFDPTYDLNSNVSNGNTYGFYLGNNFFFSHKCECACLIPILSQIFTVHN